MLGLVEDGAVRYYQEQAPSVSLLWALLADVSVLALVVGIFARLCGARHRVGRRIGAAGVIVFGLLGFYQLQRFVMESLQEWKPDQSWRIPKIAAECVLLVLMIVFRRRVLPSVVALWSILSAVFLLLAVNGLWQYHATDLHRVRDEKPAAMLAGTEGKPHLVWIIFDELDDRLLFDVRPQRIQVPEFERLRGESVYGKAHAPSTDTLWAMPSFVLGRRVDQVHMSTSRLQVEFRKGGPWMDASKLPNVFERARQLGLNTGLTGWHHPYCRLFGSELSDCSWISFGGPVVRVAKMLRPRPFIEQALYLVNWQARWSLPRIVQPLHWAYPAPEEPRMWREQQISDMEFTTANGLRMLQDPRLNLVFIHIPTPHPAGIWDTQAKKFTLANSDYEDNLALADETLGEIRRELEAAGRWDSSTVMVSGDHPYRTAMWEDSSIWTAEMARLTGSRWQPYVPFFVKLPSEHGEAVYNTAFNNVLSADLAIEILAGRLKTPAEAVNWLNGHAAESLKQ